MSGSSPDTRNYIAQGAIVVAVCIGGYMALVDGPRKHVAEARSELISIEAQLRESEALRDQVPVLTAARERCKAEVSKLAEGGHLAREERDLFAAVMSLADASSVTVEQMSPAKSSGKPLGTSLPTDAPEARDTTLAYSITATGSYRAVAVFVKGLRSGMGFSMVRSVRLMPTADERTPIVRAVIETEHFAFDATPAPSPQAEGNRVAGAGGN